MCLDSSGNTQVGRRAEVGGTPLPPRTCLLFGGLLFIPLLVFSHELPKKERIAAFRFSCFFWSLNLFPNSHAQLLSCVQLFVTPCTVACQVPLSMEFFRQEYQSGLPFPPSGDLPSPGIEPVSLVPPALAGGCLTTEPSEKHSLTTAKEISRICVAVSLPGLNCSHGWPPPPGSSPSYYSRADKNSPGVSPNHPCHLGLGSGAGVRKHITVV